MSKEDLWKFLELIKADASVSDRISKASSLEELVEIASENNLQLTLDELAESIGALSSDIKALSDLDLESMSGGRPTRSATCYKTGCGQATNTCAPECKK